MKMKLSLLDVPIVNFGAIKKALSPIHTEHVASAETVNFCFKTRLDRFWLNQDIIYNYCSESHGTGSRSESTVKSSSELCY